jgi:hypothetical protein
MPKPIHQPKVWYMKDIYTAFVNELLHSHPEWWGKYEKRVKMRNCFVYAKEGGKVVEKMSWFTWKDAVERYFFKAKEAIIQGETLRIGAGVGKIRAIRVERDFTTPAVDWASTFTQNKFDDAGHLVKIFFTDEDWCRIEWRRFKMLANETSYRFSPAGNNTVTKKGFKTEFSKALRKDPTLKFKYKFYPLLNKPKYALSNV